jgi:hypothetical protein
VSVPGCQPTSSHQSTTNNRNRNSNHNSNRNSNRSNNRNRASASNSHRRGVRVGDAGKGAGDLTLATCSSSPSQQWIFGGQNQQTQVLSLADAGRCWEIGGCDAGSPSNVDTDYTCKKLPSPGWRNHSSPCAANMAWTFNTNGTISSVMDGGCLEVSPIDHVSVEVSTCDGSHRQQWSYTTNGHESAASGQHGQIKSKSGGCIDNNSIAPFNPQYGEIVLKACNASTCNGLDHKWVHDSFTKQLVSKVAGAAGEKVCAEIGPLQNHFSVLSAVSCAAGDAVCGALIF